MKNTALLLSMMLTVCAAMAQTGPENLVFFREQLTTGKFVYNDWRRHLTPYTQGEVSILCPYWINHNGDTLLKPEPAYFGCSTTKSIKAYGFSDDMFFMTYTEHSLVKNELVMLIRFDKKEAGIDYSKPLEVWKGIGCDSCRTAADVAQYLDSGVYTYK